MKTIIILLLYLSSFSAFSKKFVIGLSDTEHGLFKKTDIKKVIQCTLGPEYDQISFLKLPYIRGVHLLNDTKINALYPVRSGDLEGLFPLYIDEVFIISKNSINLKNHINVGIIKESHSTTLKKYNNLNPTYTVNSINSLFTGLKAGRVKSIIVKRSQIPKNFSLDKYEIKSLKYEISGIALSKKDFSQKSLVEIKKNFSNCLSSMKFTLITNRKEVIYKSLLPDIKKIIKATGVIKSSKFDKNKAIKQWHSDSSHKIKEQLKKSKYSQVLINLYQSYPFINEAIVFDSMGSLVGYFGNISDFDQSDENKYFVVKNSTKFSMQNISDIYYDKSTDVFQIGISIRSEDYKSQFSGGIYLGVDLNKLLNHYKLP